MWRSYAYRLRLAFGGFLTNTADTVKHHGMALKGKTMLFGDIVLALFDLIIRELGHAATVGAYQVIVVITIVELKNSLHPVKLAARQDARLFKLREHTVDRGQANLDIFDQKRTIDVFGAQVPVLGTPEDIEHFKSRKGCLKANRF